MFSIIHASTPGCVQKSPSSLRFVTFFIFENSTMYRSLSSMLWCRWLLVLNSLIGRDYLQTVLAVFTAVLMVRNIHDKFTFTGLVFSHWPWMVASWNRTTDIQETGCYQVWKDKRTSGERLLGYLRFSSFFGFLICLHVSLSVPQERTVL